MGLLSGLSDYVRVLAGMLALCAVMAGSGQPPPGQVAPGGNSQPVQSVPAPSPQSQTPAPEPPPVTGPPIEFESKGLSYEALTKDGITVMFAPLPSRIKDYNIVQVTVTNGSPVSWTVKQSDFTFSRQDGTVLQSTSADDLVESLLQKASRDDVIKLQLLYEDSIYGLSNYRPTNGYEKRREAAMAMFVNKGFKAAAAASAITFVASKLKPGESTDGAIFFENRTKEKALGGGRFIAHTCGETFAFQTAPEIKLH